MERVPRPWTRRERDRAVAGVLSRGFTDIRTIAYRPEIAGDPAAALERIRMIADACHNLPGAVVARVTNRMHSSGHGERPVRTSENGSPRSSARSDWTLPGSMRCRQRTAQ